MNLKNMKRIGIITVPIERIDRADYVFMTENQKTPTETFFERIKQCTYHEGCYCILSMRDDNNLVLASLENNAIILLSQNEVLSPEQFIHMMVNLQECTNEMRSLLKRNVYGNYSSFEMGNLNINFADIELTTGIPVEITKEYILEKSQKGMKSNKGYSPVGITYDTEFGKIEHKHLSQYGINLKFFLHEVIKVNPDVRLLMSNVICRDCSLNYRQIVEEAIGETYEKFYWRDKKISDHIWEKILKEKNQAMDQKVIGKIQAKRQEQLEKRKSQNQQYRVYPVLRYVIQDFGEKASNLDQNYLLEWYDGDPDTSSMAIEYALNNMLLAARRADDSPIRALRTLEEVKKYMRFLNQKTSDINRKIENKEIERLENNRSGVL